MKPHDVIVARVTSVVLESFRSGADEREAMARVRAALYEFFPAGVLTVAQDMAERVVWAWSENKMTRLLYTIHVGAHQGQLHVTVGRETKLPLDGGRVTVPKST